VLVKNKLAFGSELIAKPEIIERVKKVISINAAQ
jgi:acyl-CoA hydrolase